ncbi:DNA mismatch repair endonuclease MutL [Anaerococcus provencensis]|uniref:DNA mismatch repair endonuclease MutL n=1 Tax=Anaerococcus provencensis TaxID=938293 RepID=UPI0002F43D13|nr:DNA mismatch repair endonuclease MutL [Anaerococcus provencensis]
MPIRKLDQYTIEQIAAGEVIESPFSVVKELVENSIDAKAKNITVEIKNGGKTYIRVTDDGSGIAKDDLKLAFEKHTTSKIVHFEDLYYIYSLGFRGEALSTIVSVANVRAITKTSDANIGSKIEFTNNKINESSIATNTGTSIEVLNIFANLPARYKFLKSDLAESNAITKLMYSLALGYNSIGFKYIKDDRLEFKTSANESLELRIYNLLDDNLKDELIEIDASNEIYSIKGFISSSNYYRASRSLQYLYVNNRLVDSPLIINTIENEYRTYIPNGRFPALFLFISTNPKNLDINVHPNKRTIKFIYEDDLLSLLRECTYKSLSENMYPNKITIDENKDNSLLDFSDYASVLEKYQNSSVVKENKSSYEENNFFENKDKKLYEVDEKKLESHDNYKLPSKDFDAISFTEEKSYSYLTSMFSRYSLFACSNGNIILVDNRRADEAILYNNFIKELEDGAVSQQLLLEPIVINLKANDKLKFIDKRDDLLSLGFDIDLIAEDKVLIRSIPQLFDNDTYGNFFYDLLDLDLQDRGDIFYKNIRKYIKSKSFRKGNKLGEIEARKYLDDLLNLDNPYKTYDGKAIIIELTDKDLERYFER